MAKDPLSKKARKLFRKQLADEWERKYDCLLGSGAVDTESLSEGDHTIALVVAVITGESFRPLSDNGREILSNARHFI